jgi:acylphosphatase
VSSIRRRLLVAGLVQGVWFRASCREQATARGVAGWARNLDDGRVEVVLEGAREGVAHVEAWCRHGPEHAVVTDVEATDEDPEGLTTFVTR